MSSISDDDLNFYFTQSRLQVADLKTDPILMMDADSYSSQTESKIQRKHDKDANSAKEEQKMDAMYKLLAEVCGSLIMKDVPGSVESLDRNMSKNLKLAAKNRDEEQMRLKEEKVQIDELSGLIKAHERKLSYMKNTATNKHSNGIKKQEGQVGRMKKACELMQKRYDKAYLVDLFDAKIFEQSPVNMAVLRKIKVHGAANGMDSDGTVAGEVKKCAEYSVKLRAQRDKLQAELDTIEAQAVKHFKKSMPALRQRV